MALALERTSPGVAWRVHVGYEFRDPLLTDVLERLPAHEPVDVLPMYVADSAFTHALARTTMTAWLARRSERCAPVRVLPPLPIETLAELSAAHVFRELAKRGITPGEDWAMVLAAHGTLLDPPRPYETGRIATEALARALERRLLPRFGRVTLGRLNHVYGGRWTEPPADRALRDLAAEGYRKVVYFPFGFLTDNAESLLEGRIALSTQPGLYHVHLPCLNEDPSLMHALARHAVFHAAEAADSEIVCHAGPTAPVVERRTYARGERVGRSAPVETRRIGWTPEGRSVLGAGLLHHQHAAGCVRHHMARHTAQYQLGQTGTPMRADHDQVGCFVVRGAEDHLAGVARLDAALGRNRGIFQHLLGPGGELLVRLGFLTLHRVQGPGGAHLQSRVGHDFARHGRDQDDPRAAGPAHALHEPQRRL
jgi:protoheme ferro-lyase